MATINIVERFPRPTTKLPKGSKFDPKDGTPLTRILVRIKTKDSTTGAPGSHGYYAYRNESGERYGIDYGPSEDSD